MRIFYLPWRRIPAIVLVMALELYYIFMLPLMIPYSLIAFLLGMSTFTTGFVLAFTIGVPLVLTAITWRGKMIFYALAFIMWTPFYSVLIPLYSIWKMDDFGWGSTRSITTQKEEIEKS
jgi:chitin synthase